MSERMHDRQAGPPDEESRGATRARPVAGALPPRFRPDHVLVHYSEIALKGRNRAYFENALAGAIRRGLRGLGVPAVKRIYGRLLVELGPGTDPAAVLERLRSIWGIAHFELAARVPLEVDAIERAVGEAIEGIDADSFAIVTQRANKRFPMNSVEVNRRIGQHVVERTGWKVSIKSPGLPIYIYLLDQHAYVAFERCRGAGGLPVGVAGTVACLLSGGIDSPVAAARMMRRGAAPVFVHFHSAPHTSPASQEKVIELAGFLTRFDRPRKLFMVPFAGLQRRIVTETPAPLRIILYRRFMLRAAEAIAVAEGARALVTGENLSQVSSQTLDNLATIDAAATLPVLRPVIGWDKQEIVEEAKRLGTFETSIEPHDDCCSFLMPDSPATRSRPRDLEAAEGVFDIEAEVRALVEAAEVVEVGGGETQRE